MIKTFGQREYIIGKDTALVLDGLARGDES